jgi:hypothetical protein
MVIIVVDEVGRKLPERTLAATQEGHLEALSWAERWVDRRFALEDCRYGPRQASPGAC